jgi:hypothetical protein
MQVDVMFKTNIEPVTLPKRFGIVDEKRRLVRRSDRDPHLKVQTSHVPRSGSGSRHHPQHQLDPPTSGFLPISGCGTGQKTRAEE